MKQNKTKLLLWHVIKPCVLLHLFWTSVRLIELEARLLREGETRREREREGERGREKERKKERKK